MKKNNTKAFAFLLGLTIITKLLGFLKTTITAAFYGMSIETDIYNLANGTVSELMYAIAISVSVIIVPLYMERKRCSEQDGKCFAKSACLSLWIFGIGITLLIYACTPFLARLLGRAYTEKQIQTMIQYMRAMETGIVLSLVVNALQSLLNAERSYGYSSVCAMINSVVIIGFVFLFSQSMGMWALVLSGPVAYLVQLIFLRIKASSLLKYPVLKCRYDSSIKKLYLSAIPLIMSNATKEIYGFVDKYILANVETGAVTASSYAYVLLTFVTNIISIPLSTILFTDVSDYCAQKEYNQARKITENAILGVILVCAPITIIATVCSHNVVTLIYGYGAYDPTAVFLTAQALSIYSLTIVFYIMNDILNRVAYALLDTKIPLIASIVSVAAHVAVSLLLSRQWGMRGVIFGTLAGVIVAFVITWSMLSNKHLQCRFLKNWPSILRVILSAVVMVLIVLHLENNVKVDCFIEQINAFLNLVIYAVVGFLVYFGLLWFAREPVLHQLIGNILKGRERK